jgi:hypothetical protein
MIFHRKMEQSEPLRRNTTVTTFIRSAGSGWNSLGPSRTWRGAPDPRSGRSFNFPKKDGTSPAINCGKKNIKIEIFILDIYI